MMQAEGALPTMTVHSPVSCMQCPRTTILRVSAMRQAFKLLIQRQVLVAFPLVHLCAVHVPFDFLQLDEVCERMLA